MLSIASTIEKVWSNYNLVNIKCQIKICIEHALAEDLPCKAYNFTYSDKEQPIVGKYVFDHLESKLDSEIKYRVDFTYKPIYQPDERLVYSNIDAYNVRIKTFMDSLLESNAHTILICSHKAETHDAYMYMSQSKIDENHENGIMANFVKNDKTWEIKYNLLDWHSKVYIKVLIDDR